MTPFICIKATTGLNLVLYCNVSSLRNKYLFEELKNDIVRSFSPTYFLIVRVVV